MAARETGSYFILNGARTQYARALTTYTLNSGLSFGTYLSVSLAKS